MVKILYVEGDKTTRDAIRVALDQFKGFEGTFVTPTDAAAELQGGRHHVIFVEDAPDPEASLALLESLCGMDGRLPVVMIAEETSIKTLVHEKKRLNISAFLRKPLDPVEVFKLLGRLREKINAMDLTVR